jgi:FixJ family two-component response regulator
MQWFSPERATLSNLQHVTVIDDDQSLRLSLMSLVRSLGHDADGYHSADAFLNSGQLDRPDCIVTDVQMPGTDGIALKHELDRRGSSTPVIMITARSETSLHGLAKESAPFAILKKPLEMKLFIELLRRALETRSPVCDLA